MLEKPFHNSIIGNFMVYQDRLETNLLQLFVNPKNTKRFSRFSVVCEASIVAEQNQAQLVTILCFL